MAKKNSKINSQITNKSAKGVRIKNKKELVAFLNAYGVAKNLKFLASIMLPPQTKFRLKFSVGDSSYTDNKKEIVIGIPESMIGRTKEEILADAKWRLIHEVGHLLYTSSKTWDKFVEEFKVYMNTKHSISEAIATKVGNNIINCLEDGREEHVMKIENPGNEKYITFGRSLWYFSNEIIEVNPGEEIIRELFDTLFGLASLSTMGVYPKSYASVYQHKPELLDMMRNLKPLVNQFINCTDANPLYGLSSAIPIAWTIIYQIEDWMVDLMKQIPEPTLDDLLDNFGSQAGANGSQVNSSYGGSGNIKTQPQSPGGVNKNMGPGTDPNSKQSGTEDDGNDPNSKQPETEDDDSNSQKKSTTNGDGGRITRVNDSDDTEYDTDMNEIVEEAMRNAIKETIEEEYDSVQQADFDDMLHKDKEETEAEDATPEDIQAVEDYYATLNKDKRGGQDWTTKLDIETYNYNPIEAPTKVKVKAKLLNKEFEKIFLNKSAMDSKNRRRGELNTHDLYKLRNRDYNIFIKRGRPRNTDYVFYILVDGSGSMSGDKFTEALRACSILEESLKGIADVKIVMFDYNDTCRHRIIKGFKEIQKGNASWTFSNKQRSGCCNMDGFSIRVATKELQRRTERKKILFTLSDGQPNGPYNYSGDRGENDVTEAVLEARKNGISVFNIFFAESKRERDMNLPSFCHMYRNKGIISCAPDNIATELLRVVKRELVN